MASTNRDKTAVGDALGEQFPAAQLTDPLGRREVEGGVARLDRAGTADDQRKRPAAQGSRNKGISALAKCTSMGLPVASSQPETSHPSPFR